MKKSTILASIAVLLVGLIAVGAFAMPFDNETQIGNRGRSGMDDALVEAFESGDYDAYMAALDENDRPFMKEKLTEEEFNERIQFRQENLERRLLMEENREKIDTAIKTGDYNVWLETIESLEVQPRIAEDINEENFATFVEFHNAKQAQDFETAEELAEELGLERPKHKKMGQGMGKGRNSDMQSKGTGCQMI